MAQEEDFELEQDQKTGDDDDPAAGGQDGQGADEAKSVPMSAFTSMRKDMEEKLKTLTDELALTKAQLQYSRPQQPGTQDEDDEEVVQEKLINSLFEGREDDDVLTVEDVKNMLRKSQKARKGVESPAIRAISEMRFMQDHPDYSEVVQTHLQGWLKSRPPAEQHRLAMAIQSSSEPYLVAYYLGMLNPDFQKARHDKAKRDEIERIKANQERPRSSASVSGSGKTAVGISRYANMSPEDLEKEIQRVKRKASL